MTDSQAQLARESPYKSHQSGVEWTILDKNSQQMSKEEFIDFIHKKKLKSLHLNLIKTQSNTDNIGWQHHRYVEYYKGVEILGTMFIVHEHEQEMIKSNGFIIDDLNINTIPLISSDLAIHIAKDKLSPDNSVKIAQPKLSIADRHYPLQTNDLFLCYKLEVFTQLPISKKLILIDAMTGEIIQSIELLHTNSVEGIAHTKYNGIQTITTDSIGKNKFILFDRTRGDGIRTVDNNNSNSDFEDTDNIWDNKNGQQDEIATDAHFASEKTYDFFMSNFNHNSYDNKGTSITNKVHVGTNFNNAFWDGKFLNFGDGDGIKYGPHISLDICAHEFTHGVTQESAGLIYRYESGALNESFSDIFGKTIENEYSPNDFSWNLGQKIALKDEYIFRSMKNPNERFHPKFYKGKYWEYSEFDQGGVHINSGVLNYWYYLLVEGGFGNNEIKEFYHVDAIGFTKAIKIVYRMLTVYLTPSSTYIDAYNAALNATEDLYGFCSSEYESVKQAWHAIGFGQSLNNKDLAIEMIDLQTDDCRTKDVKVTVNIINNSCRTTLPIGATIQVGFKYNNFIPIQDEITLTTPLLPNDTITYSFFNIIKVRRQGIQNISAWLSQFDDPNTNNDTSRYSFNYLPYQNSDFALMQSNPTTDLICGNYDKIFLYNQLQYLGCDTLPKGTIIPYKIIIKKDTLIEMVRTRLRTAPQMIINFTTKINYTQYGFDNAIIELDYPNDMELNNNKRNIVLYKIQKIKEGYEESFINGYLDSTRMLISTGHQNINHLQEKQANDHQLIMTGHNILDKMGNLNVRTHTRDDIYFRLNEDFMTNITFCSDISQLESPTLSFDLAQTKSNINFQQLGIKSNNTTMVGLKIDGNPVGDLIRNPTKDGSFYHYEFDLVPYKHLRSVSIQLKCLALQSSVDTNGIIQKDGDNNILDNIKLFSKIPTKQSTIIPNKKTAEWLIFPNPCSTNWTMRKVNSSVPKSTTIQIFDTSGKLILDRTFTNPTYEMGNSLSKGIYILKILEGNIIIEIDKIIKQ